MSQHLYPTGRFARQASVSVRTLRYYDQIGLLSPSHYSRSGHRLYTEADLGTLQQILALKYLGFSLLEIKGYLQAAPEQLQTALAKQKAMLSAKRAQLDTIIRAIEQVARLAQADQCPWEAIIHMNEVMQMEQKNEWVNQYFTPEQRQKMEELSQQSYSEAAREKMATWSEWTEADQRRVDAQYAALWADLKRVVAAGQDPAGVEAQDLARRQIDLIEQFTQSDPDIEAGLKQWWQNFQALPADQKPMVPPTTDEEQAFLAQAMAIYRQQP